MVHKPKHKVHSFRGLLADGGQDEINLERQNVNQAYRIVKFQIFTEVPGAVSNAEHVMKIYRFDPGTTDATVNFSDTSLLAADFLPVKTSEFQHQQHVIFDNTLFSRNIFVTHNLAGGAGSCNYYIEIEEVPVNASTLMQLKLGVARKLSLTQ